MAVLGGYTALALFLAVANSLTYLSTGNSPNWKASIERSLGKREKGQGKRDSRLVIEDKDQLSPEGSLGDQSSFSNSVQRFCGFAAVPPRDSMYLRTMSFPRL